MNDLISKQNAIDALAQAIPSLTMPDGDEDMIYRIKFKLGQDCPLV